MKRVYQDKTFRLSAHLPHGLCHKMEKPVFADEIGDFMVATAKRLCDGYGGELISRDGQRPHPSFSVPATI